MDKTKGKRNILAQVLIAFGQGTGPVRVSRKAGAALIEHYKPMIDESVVESWDSDGVQALERVRATGRSAAYRMVKEARTFINVEDVCESYERVERISSTSICGRD